MKRTIENLRNSLPRTIHFRLVSLVVLLIAVLATQVQAEKGLVGHWKFDDGAKNRVDGKIGKAARFSGKGSISLAKEAAVLGKLTDFTLSMWVQYDGGPGRTLFSFYISQLSYTSEPLLVDRRSIRRIQMEVNEGTLRFGWHGGHGFQAFATKPLAWEPGRWYHVVFVCDSKLGKSILRSNDLVWKTNANTLTPAGLKWPVTNVDIGSLNGKCSFNGCIDDVRMYDLVMPVSEQLAIYEAHMDKPAASWAVARDKFLEEHRMRRLRLDSVDADKQIAAGKSLTVAASLIALDDVAEGTTKVQIIRDGAVVANADILSPATKAGATTAIGPVELAIPTMAWGGRHEIVIRRRGTRIEGHEDGQVAEVNVIARKPRSTKYSVKLHNGTLQMFEGDTPLPSASYMYSWSNPDQISRLAQADVHLYWLSGRRMGWVGKDKYDYTLIDELLAELFTCDPQARVVFWFNVGLPASAQPATDGWWQKENPSELCRDASGSTRNSGTVFGYGNRHRQVASFASTKWRKDSAAAMKRFILHMEGSPFADRIVGYQPSIGSEGWYHGGCLGVFVDYSDPTVRAFRDWLRDRYDGRQADLRAAWASDTVTFDSAKIPTPAKRKRTTLGALRDPQTARPVIDYYTFFAELTAGTADYFCSAVKEATGGTKIAGVWYGYIMELAFGWANAQHSGHQALGRALESDAIDFLMSPTSYWARGPGQPGGHMSALGSLRLHQKMWVNQSDLRSHLWPPNSGFGQSANEDQSVGTMRREFAMDLAAGVPMYWYCFSYEDRMKNKKMMEGVKQMAEIGAEAGKLERGLDGDGIAVIVSDDIAAHIGLSRQPLRSLVYLQREFLNRSGVKFDVFLDSDLDHPDMPRYKAYLFLCAISMDADRRAWIDTNLKGDGRVLAFVWAQGMIGDTLALSNVEKLCGIDLGMEKVSGVITLQPKPGLGPKYGGDEAFGPVLYSDDETAEVLGRLTSPAAVAGKAGLSVKRFPDWTSVYSAAPKLSPEVIRTIAKLAGVHVWSESNDPIYVGRRYLGIHAKAAGKRSIKLPSRSTVVECFSKREIGRDVDQLDIELDDFETKIYRIK